MMIEPWISYAPEVFVIGLPLDGVFCQGMFSVLEGKRILEDADEDLVSC
jgi:hypothetical protein